MTEPDAQVPVMQASLDAAQAVMDRSAYRIWPADAKQNIAEAIEQARLSGFEEGKEAAVKAGAIIDLWFAPWGAAKGEQWEEMSGDRPFDPNVALELIRDALPPSTTGAAK